MIKQLQSLKSYERIKPLLNSAAANNVVINGVLDGNNLGRVYANHPDYPTAALVWAQNEMLFLIGEFEEEFYCEAEELIVNVIKPAALQIGEDYLNLEVYSSAEAHSYVSERFRNRLHRGERVPFAFQKELFLNRYSSFACSLPGEYKLAEIDEELISSAEPVLTAEILKFWESTESFLQKGIGYCMMRQNEVIGTCISVYVSGNEYEIGIHVYDPWHRGRGLASVMAVAFIYRCLGKGGTPHWTTESFRSDSISVARKVGFKQLPAYTVYYLAYSELTDR
ncbi:GNAT acetyltransferase [compost metagenome]